MKILVTGAHGFIGKNLVCRLKNEGFGDIYEYTRESSAEDLKRYTSDCSFVFHIAGVNRPKDVSEFTGGNVSLTNELLAGLEDSGNKAPVLITSSIQAGIDNPYGVSKRSAEEAVYEHGIKNGTSVFIYRMPNVFGKWSRPDYNSAVATFCHNTARHLPITVNDRNHAMELVYVDDVVGEFIEDLKIDEMRQNEWMPLGCPIYSTSLGNVADIITSFGDMRNTLEVPDMSDPLTSKLYSTYLSFLPESDFSYPLLMHEDARGSFTEFIRTPDRGQFSVNISHPGITKGQHWHDSKNEKYLVVKGHGLIRFRKIGEELITDYHVSGEKLEAVDIPTGYTHCIINEGNEDMVTLMWANEVFDPEHPDTYREEV